MSERWVRESRACESEPGSGTSFFRVLARERVVAPELLDATGINRDRGDGLDASVDDSCDKEMTSLNHLVTALRRCVAKSSGAVVADQDIFDFDLEAEGAKLRGVTKICEILEYVLRAFDLTFVRAIAFHVPDDVVGPERTKCLAVAGGHGLKEMVDEERVWVLGHLPSFLFIHFAY
jgi:hypothetical protein